jgi:type II secretory pathway predicted ATPase ExeA
MIEERFGLERAPFRLGTDVSFYYESEAHRRAMAHLRYGLRQAEGFVVITGEPGVGKTILVEHLLTGLDDTDVLAATLPPVPVTPETLAARVLSAFEEEAGEGEDAMAALTAFLIRTKERGLRASLIVDEAQRLSDETLEELRLLSNLSADGESLLQVCLIGQTGLRSVLYRADMEQFRQRIVASYHLAPLSAADTEAYLRHRLAAAGWRGEGDLFTAEAAGAVHREAGGVPRRINQLASRAMMQAALDDAAMVEAPAVEAVAREIENDLAMPEGGEATTLPTAPEAKEEPTAENAIIRFPSRAAIDAERTRREEERRAQALAEEEAEAERALAMLTAEPDAEEAAAPAEEEPKAEQEEDRTSRARAAGGGPAGRYPITVSEVNAAVFTPFPQNDPVSVAAPGQGLSTGEAPKRRLFSPMEMMMATGPGGRAIPRQAEEKEAEAPAPAEAEAPAPAEAEKAPETTEEGRTGIPREVLEGFLEEAGEALAALREALETVRNETSALDERRRARREAIGSRIDEARERLVGLRGE